MKAYLDLLRHVFENGQVRSDRTGVGTRSVFGAQMRMNLCDGLPLLTTKKIHFKSVLVELLWFLRGDTNIKFLHDHGVTIWDEWADGNGDLGPVYGRQWRRWETIEILPAVSRVQNVNDHRLHIDQIALLIHDLKNNPYSRRHIVTAWNPADVPRMALPPCHTLWQCYVSDPGLGDSLPRLSLHLYARSIDIFLGLPFNLASYGLLTAILARAAGMLAYELIVSFGDLHLYANHVEQAREQLSRVPRRLPTVKLIPTDLPPLDQLLPEHFELVRYDPLPPIKAPIAV